MRPPASVVVLLLDVGCWVLGVECDLALAAGGGPAVALELVAFELVAVAVCAPLMTASA